MAGTVQWGKTAEQWVSKYIPAGCLDVPSGGLDLPPEIWILTEMQGWSFVTRPQDHNHIPEPARLQPKFQQALLRAPILQPFLGLWRRQWIQLAFSTLPGLKLAGRVRVYILPHDTTRGRISSTEDEKLTKTVPKLLALLDYSAESWDGQCNDGVRQNQPTPFGTDILPGDDATLLDMFNNVPSPDPDPSIVVDPDTRDAMQCLLQSKVPGLQSTLYSYQRNSTALMLQREMEPRRIIDPRLRPSLDQYGKPWYFDTVTGLVLREPNYYDAPRGGILAEEMGTGKTLICLALIIATKQEPTKAPEPFVAETPHRSKKGSLMDMAAATANRHSVAWKPYFEACEAQLGLEYKNCINALEKPENRAFYRIKSETLVGPRRSARMTTQTVSSKKVYLSSCNLIIIPNNLVTQWTNEIRKHTTGLRVLVIIDKTPIPQMTVLLTYDVIIFSQTRFEMIQRERQNSWGSPLDIYCPLEYIRFKRCIIDEGHKLGLNGPGYRSDMMRIIDRLEIAARWVVTGTPSRGLYGVDQGLSVLADPKSDLNGKQPSDVAIQQEREDLQRIGNMAAKYLKVRPWANTKEEAGDTVADWNLYVMNQRQHSKGHNRRDCLKGTLDSLIIRHRLADVSHMLPPVSEKIVLLDGSFQDRLSLNLFSMMIIFNSVQSQRMDMDYFFHPRQRKSLVQLVNNLRQASFFGGVFFSAEDIARSVQTAEEFLEKKAVPIGPGDEKLLREAIAFGKLAARNRLKDVSNRFHALPIFLENFPGGAGSGKSWSLVYDDKSGGGEGDEKQRGEDEDNGDGEPVCTDAGLVLALQRYLNPCIDAPASLQLMIESGRLDIQGKAERTQALAAATDAAGRSAAAHDPHHHQAEILLAGHTPLGDDHHHTKPFKQGTLLASPFLGDRKFPASEPTVTTTYATVNSSSTSSGKIEIAGPLARTRIISTVSAKLSYLIDAIVRYQDEEQIIVFYDNNNIAFYLAGVLEILQIQHLIYTRAGLSAERRAQYVATFSEEGSRFRVLLMDISQAAFGLDMRSASRVYFISPVLNPQVEAQAVARARRVVSSGGGGGGGGGEKDRDKDKVVTVETLVLRGSIEELVVDRRRRMSRAEHRRVSSVLDDRPMYDWILNARILPMGAGADTVRDADMDVVDMDVERGGEGEGDGLAQTARLRTPQFVFGRGFGRDSHPDEGLLPNGDDNDGRNKNNEASSNKNADDDAVPGPETADKKNLGSPETISRDFPATTTTTTTTAAAATAAETDGTMRPPPPRLAGGLKRPHSPAPLLPPLKDTDTDTDTSGDNGAVPSTAEPQRHASAAAAAAASQPPAKRRARVAWADEDM